MNFSKLSRHWLVTMTRLLRMYSSDTELKQIQYSQRGSSCRSLTNLRGIRVHYICLARFVLFYS